METYDRSYFLGKIFFSDDGSQNIFVYHPTFSVLQIKKTKSTHYIICWKSKWIDIFVLFFLQYNAFLHNFSETKFDRDPNYVTKIVNAYIIYELHT